MDLLMAQSADFEAFPRMNVEYTHLDLQLSVNDDLLVEGEAVYRLRTRRGGLDSLILDAAGIEVQQLAWNDSELDYRVENDRLVILLPDGITNASKSAASAVLICVSTAKW